MRTRPPVSARAPEGNVSQRLLRRSSASSPGELRPPGLAGTREHWDPSHTRDVGAWLLGRSEPRCLHLQKEHDGTKLVLLLGGSAAT